MANISPQVRFLDADGLWVGKFFGMIGWRASRAIGTAVAALVAAAGVAVFVATISVDRVPADWTVNGEIGESSQLIPIRAAHPECPSWSNLGGLVVTTVETDNTVALTVTFPRHEAPCDWMGTPMRATVKLDAPLGDRTLIDGATGGDPATPALIAFRTGQAPAD